MPDVIVLGPASWNQLVRLERLPDPRPQTVFAQGCVETLGGTSAGKALHLTDLGRSTQLHTVVGADDSADRIVGALTGAGVDLAAVAVPGPSERHLNLMTARGERVSIYLSTPNDPPQRSLADWGPLLRDPRAVVLDLAGWTRAIAEEACATRLPVWTDLHDYDGTDEFHRPFIDAASHVFVSGDRLASPTDFLHSLIDSGRELAVCTLGAEGAIAVDADGWQWRVPAAPVTEVVDTNGAGDAFFAGFLDATLDGASVQLALAAGAGQAVRAITSEALSPLLE